MGSIWTVRRSATDAKLAGLCGGVAEHWGVDPVLVRVGWVLLALSGGVGVVLYLAGWLLVPVAGRPTAPADDLLGDLRRRWPREAWVALVVAACLVVFAVFNGLAPFGIGPALAIAAIWYVGFYRQRQHENSRRPAAPPPPPPAVPPFVSHPGPATPFTEAADAWRRRIEEHAARSAPPATTAAPAARPAAAPAQAPAPAAGPDPEQAARAAFLAAPDPVGLYAEPVRAVAIRPRDRLSARRLRVVTLVALGFVLAGLGTVDALGAAVPATVYPAAALVVVGLGLVVATWLGRARGLLPLGLLLVPVVALSALVGPLTQLDQWQQSTRSYTTAAELPPAGDAQAAGQLEVDLRGLRPTADTTYRAHVGTGRLAVTVPDGVDVTVHYDVGYGAADVFGQVTRGGHDVTGTVDPAPGVAAAPTLTLDLSVDHGQLEVLR